MEIEQFEPSEELTQYRSVVRQLLERHADPRVSLDGGEPCDRPVWRRLAESGALGFALRSEAACSLMFDVALVAEEIGRIAGALPYSTAAAGSGVLLGASGTAPALSDAFQSGERLIIPVLPQLEELTSPFLTDGDGPEVSVSGAEPFAADAAAADTLLVVARSPRGTAVVAIDVSAHGVSVEPQPGLDQGRRPARVTLDAAPATLLAAGQEAEALAGEARQRIRVAMAAEATGVAARALELSTRYALERHQFDRPIGAFQAIKHRLADMLVATENARSAAYIGARAIDITSDTAGAEVALAKAVATENAHKVVESAIQLHGAIGVTWEHPLHLFLRRTKSLSLVFGEPQYHFSVIGSALAAGELKAAL